ncbi:MAG TPA: adenylosuccinate lyase [Nitrospirae bacterium]|nr:adenylosuccinate lyase [bacterium BMS3Bbin09]HDH34604.1 adenylosuccinate lyase [Nitrospirota bacterium]HDN94715.1 adenylosuccinate lyase [Nitrospirota bacterium]HDO67493.1 adenylosuccinate lyase [Nitrospirota bacterium]HDZ84389.1 adenylosuccinate lyase [Nitrospirota bacterium]
MIPRYSRPEMARIWEPENKFQKWLDVEIAACEAWAELGEIPKKSLATIKKKATFNIKRIDKIELKVKHDVIAFLTSVAENVGPDSRYIHKGLTSSDIGDTALALLMREAADIIIQDIKDLMKVLRTNAHKYKKTLQMGRSHGIHAEPTTFGLTFALWYEEMKRNLARMEAARETINYGQLSGPVGTFTSLPPSIEKYVCKKLKLRVDPIVTQVIQRDRHAEYMNTLALIAGAIEKMSVEIRHLQRTEVLEAEEPFAKGQKGSSAMPHKRNPIGSENLSGLARVVRSNAMAAMENIPLWHERDISHSSVERIIVPDSTILINYMLKRLTGILAGLQVYPDRMKENIGKSYGLFCSQRVLIRLTESGLSREDAYKVVQARAMEAWKQKVPYKDLLKQDKVITKYLSNKDIEALFDMKYYTKNIDLIYKRVFGAAKKRKKK